VLITVILLFAVCYPAALAQNLSSMNNYSNNSSNTATPNSSAKTVVIPQGNKAPITTANSAATGKSNNVQAGNNRTGFANVSNLVIKIRRLWFFYLVPSWTTVN
jgi:flagellar hook-length control protein FliK